MSWRSVSQKPSSEKACCGSKRRELVQAPANANNCDDVEIPGKKGAPPHTQPPFKTRCQEPCLEAKTSGLAPLLSAQFRRVATLQPWAIRILHCLAARPFFIASWATKLEPTQLRKLDCYTVPNRSPHAEGCNSLKISSRSAIAFYSSTKCVLIPLHIEGYKAGTLCAQHARLQARHSAKGRSSCLESRARLFGRVLFGSVPSTCKRDAVEQVLSMKTSSNFKSLKHSA